MSFFKLTIAEDVIQKKTQSYKNVTNFLSAFIISFTVTLVSGFWFFAVSHEINWNASQMVLILHLLGGGLSFMLFLVYFFLHQRDKELQWWRFLIPWQIRPEEDETPLHLKQRKLGVYLTWLLLIIYLTGLSIALPGAVFFLGYLHLYSFEQLMLLNNIHVWATFIMLPILLMHFLWSAKNS